METPHFLNNFFSYIDENKNLFVENLREAVAIKSVSAWHDNRMEVQRMIDFIHNKLEKLGATVEQCDIGYQNLESGSQVKLPNVILGTLGDDPSKKTICVYGHLDVQPALKEDGWETDPFILTEKDGKLYGRGASDDKGPIMCWIHAIEAIQSLGEELPVNLKFIFEGMEESGSKGLDELLLSRTAFFKDVDYVCVSDGRWLGNSKPCVTYGLRGLCYFHVEVEGAKMDLHSGMQGGNVYEPMNDLIAILNELTDVEGKILIPNIYEDVAELAENEEEIYENIDFDVEKFKESIGAFRLMQSEDKTQILMHRWRYPSLSIHGIEGASSDLSTKTVIPGKVIGKFSIRIVPNQQPDEIERNVVDYLNSKWLEIGCETSLKVYMAHSGKPWLENPDHPHYRAAINATEMVYKIKPDLIREGVSVPITLTLQEISGKNVLVLPIGCVDDGAHSQNEKINLRNYIEGTKLLGAYMFEVSKIQ